MAALAAVALLACKADSGMNASEGKGGSVASGGAAGLSDAANGTGGAAGGAGPDVAAISSGGTGVVTTATGGATGMGGAGKLDAGAAGSSGTGGAGRGGSASGGTLGTAGAVGLDASLAGGAGGTGGMAGNDAASTIGAGTGGRSDGPAAGGASGTGGVGGGDASSTSGTGGVTADPCNPPQPVGTHTIHFRYVWAGQKTLTLFPKPAFMPKSIDLGVKNGTNTTTVTCTREQDRPWFGCPVPDSYFGASATWRASDKAHAPEWNTVAYRPLPSVAGEYWLRWLYGRPDIPRTQDPPNFEFLDYYPDAVNGDWSAMGQWNDSACVAKPPANPVTVSFDFGGWFPYKSTQYKYPYGGSLAQVYPTDGQSKAQGALDAFVFQRYNLWKKNWVKYDADACGTGTARVWSDNPAGTVSEGQGYGIATSAAIGDKDLFDKLWSFVRHYLSSSRYCGLMGWMWSSSSDCQSLDARCDPGTTSCSGNTASAFDSDVDIGIGLVYAALQWPEYTEAATDWLVKMECEVNTKYGDGFNYPTEGDNWDKTCSSGGTCDYAPGTASSVFNDYYPPGYFRVFGDFLAAKLGADAKASNGQTHHDFWYKTAETVYELVERCYDQTGVNPGLIGDGGTITSPCSNVGGGQPYEWGRELWRVGIDAAWFGNNTDLPEAKASSSSHFAPKSRIQAKMDNAQGFYANFYKNNPPEANANRFSSLCDQLSPAGTVTSCDPSYGHNSYTVNMAMCPFASSFDNGGATTTDIRREALEESMSTTVSNDHYFQESLGVYSMLFLTGNFPNPMTVPTK